MLRQEVLLGNGFSAITQGSNRAPDGKIVVMENFWAWERQNEA